MNTAAPSGASFGARTPAAATVICDPAAYRALTGRRAPTGPVLIVVGQGDGTPEHRITAGAGDRARYAARVARRLDARAIICSGFRGSGRVSEARQMAALLADAGVPVLCDEASSATGRHAVNCLPLLDTLGSREVLVVSSWWHAPRAAALIRLVLAGYGYRVRAALLRHGTGSGFTCATSWTPTGGS